MKRICLLVMSAVLLTSVAWAQQSSSESPAATKEDIQKLFSTLHLQEIMKNAVAASFEQSKQMALDALKRKGTQMSDEQLKRMNVFFDDFAKKMDLSGMLDDMVPVYQRHLTQQDVSAMLAFYNTPTGQKLLREQPAMMAEGMQAVRPRMEKMMNDVTDQAEKMATEDAGKSAPSAK
jgi:hypothetical protein